MQQLRQLSQIDVLRVAVCVLNTEIAVIKRVNHRTFIPAMAIKELSHSFPVERAALLRHRCSYRTRHL
jgi:hypothetical protein